MFVIVFLFLNGIFQCKKIFYRFYSITMHYVHVSFLLSNHVKSCDTRQNILYSLIKSLLKKLNYMYKNIRKLN
jgi:hypothetical protein